MACTGLYTKEELIEKIKELDSKMETGVTGTDLDTSQSKQALRMSLRQLERQKETYLAQLKRVDPACYRAIMGPSVIKFKGPSC